MADYAQTALSTDAWVIDAKELSPSRLDAAYYRPDYINLASELKHLPCGVASFASICARLNCGSTPKQVEYAKQGLPLIRGREIRADQFDSFAMERVEGLRLAADAATAVLPGDILYTMSGANVGLTCVYPHGQELASFSNTVARGRVRSEKENDPYFIGVFLNSRLGRAQTLRLISGAVQGHVMPSSVKRFLIPTPKPAIQRAIGNKLRKAERLRDYGWSQWKSATSILEAELGISLRAETFAKLASESLSLRDLRCLSTEPAVVVAMIDNVLGAQYYHPRRVHARELARASGKWAELAELAERIGENGARTDAQQFVGLDRIDSATGIVGDARPGLGDSNDSDLDCGPGPLFEAEDVLFSRLRPYLNKVSIWPTDRAPATGSGELLVYRSRGEIDPFYLFFVLKSPLGLYQVIDVTSGSTHPRVDADVVDSVLIPRLKPGREVAVAAPVREAIAAWYAAPSLIAEAQSDVAALVDGRLDTQAVLEEGEKIERWLKRQERTTSAREA